MHRVGSAGSNGGSVRSRKEKRLTYVLDANDTKVRLPSGLLTCLSFLYYLVCVLIDLARYIDLFTMQS